MSATLHELHDLRAELRHVRATHGRRSSQAQVAFERLNRSAHLAGAPLDGLRRHSKDETERFFARTVPGPDAHVYWVAGQTFRKNDGRNIAPRRWWWQHLHGAISRYTDVVAMCGDRACINPEHCETGRHLLRHGITHSALIGAMQVAALRLGHTPGQNEWKRLGLHPMPAIYRLRFGSWQRALEAAGLQPNHLLSRTYTDAECLDALRFARQRLGGVWPSMVQYDALRARVEEELPTRKTITRHIGSWNEALRRARRQ